MYEEEDFQIKHRDDLKYEYHYTVFHKLNQFTDLVFLICFEKYQERCHMVLQEGGSPQNPPAQDNHTTYTNSTHTHLFF